MKSRFLAIGALLIAAGCGGGGGGGSAPAAPVNPPDTGGPKQTASLTISFPYFGTTPSADARHPQFVSPNSKQIRVQVNTVNGGAPPSWVAADVSTPLTFTGGSPNCTVTSGTATCTIPIAAPPGLVNYTISAEDLVPNVLARKTLDVTMVQGTNNTPTVTLQGVVSTVTVSGTALAANTPIASGEVLTVSAFDASSAQIVNGTTSANFANPITLTDNDATGQTQLTVNGGAASNAVTVNNPADVVKLTYTGQAANNFTIAASGTGISGGGTIATNVLDVTFTGTTLDDAAHGGLNTDPNWGQDTLFFSQASGSQNITAAELGWTNAPYTKNFDVSLSAGCAGIASAGASPQTTFTITLLGGVGICSGRFAEHGTGYPLTNHAANTAGNPTHDGTFWISVTTSSVGVNSNLRHN